ncbi:multidrug effflux MFS transporter [Pseudochrobactrum asaccharolyticum]|uniref:multidrug effflux MFS transporter n=1 Tax=Pseudochrobactrum asaccharolyticum TaxID=354351 RepID=UPI0040435927
MPDSSPREKASPLVIMSERRVGIIGGFLSAIGPLAMSLYTPAMPDIVAAFGTTESAVKLTLTAYFGGFCFAQLICGPLSDGYGRKPITILFMSVYLAASVLALLAPTIEIMVLARLLQGVGAAVGVTMSRAIVRDLFTSDQSARVMNLIGIVLSVGPAIGPTLGGLTLEFFGWHAIFMVMILQGIVVITIMLLFVQETGHPDPSRIRPKTLIRSYFSLLKTPHFLLASLVLTGATGALYTSATIMPFILMSRVGLSPSQFGMGMLLQTAFYISGGIIYRLMMHRLSVFQMSCIGLLCTCSASILLAVMLRIYEPSYLRVMLPMGLYVMGIAFLTPQMTTVAMAPFPQIAGSASALMGFFQMGGGLVGGILSASMGDPVIAMATLLPLMGLLSLISYIMWNRFKLPLSQTIEHPITPKISEPR